jgi:hypothetical protein
MNSAYESYVQDPIFQTLLQELRRFGYISYISVHASLNNIAHRGDASTKQFIQDFKAAFSQDLNRMADFLKEHEHAVRNSGEDKTVPAVFPLPDISDISRTIIALSFPFFLKTYNSNR